MLNQKVGLDQLPELRRLTSGGEAEENSVSAFDLFGGRAPKGHAAGNDESDNGA